MNDAMPQIRNISELNEHFGALRKEQMELWVYFPDGQSLCALISGEFGWMMYLRQEEDAGFSTRNPDYRGPKDALIEYTLENGQTDYYPANWTLPLDEIQKAIHYFLRNSEPASWLTWNNDSGDGADIGLNHDSNRE